MHLQRRRFLLPGRAIYHLSVLIALLITALLLMARFETSALAESPDHNSPNVQASTPTWTPFYDLLTTLVPTEGGRANAGFGYSVASGAILWESVVVGSPFAFNNRGKVYVYAHQSTEWNQILSLSAPDSEENDYFGASVALSRDTIAVGAYGDDDAGSGAGSVYIYAEDSQTQVWSLQAKLVAPDAAPGDQFGYSIAMNNDVLIVGAPGDDAGLYTDVGAAYIFRRSGTVWSLEQKLSLDYLTKFGFNPYAGDNAHFGYSVDIYGDQAIAGAPGAALMGGNVYIFRRDNAKWYMYSPLFGAGGYSVAIYHDVAVSGDPFYDGWGTDSGRIRVYKMTAPTALDPFVEQANSAYSLFGPTHQGGYSVDVYQEISQAGAPFGTAQPIIGPVTGNVVIFQPDPVLVKGTLAANGAEFGASISRFGPYLAVGAPKDDYNGLSPGSVYLYRISGPPWATPTQTPASGYFPTSTFVMPTATTPTFTPPTPTAPPSASPVSNFFTVRNPTLTWNRAASAFGYRLEIDDAPDFVTPLEGDDFSADTLHYTAFIPVNGTYYWRICAKDAAGVCGAWSVTQTFVISAEP